MNCFNHPQLTAVAQCVECNKGLCPECASTYSIPICSACNKKRIEDERADIHFEMFMTFVFGLVASFFIVKWTMVDVSINYRWMDYITFGIVFFYMFSGIISGWKTLTYLTPQVFLILPLLGWVIYFLLKLFLAFWVGLVALPIRTIRNIGKLSSLKKIPV